MIEGIVNAKSAWFIFFTGVLLIVSFSSDLRGKLYANTNALDVLVAAVLIYTIFSSFAHGSLLFSQRNIEIFALLIFYLVAKKMYSQKPSGDRLYIICFLCLTIIQIVIAVLQWFELMPSYNYNFKFTGFFFNPGPFAIYLSALMTLCLTVFLFSADKIIKIIGLMFFLLSLPVVLVTVSRAAWLGAIVALFFVVEARFKFLSKLLRYIGPGAKITLVALLITVTFFSSYYLYTLKKDSANGRLLTWKMTGLIVRDHPVTGVGPGNFSASLFKYQSQYFQQHPDLIPREGRIADETWYAFNDILQITAEQGVIGLVLILALLFTASKAAIRLMKAIHSKETYDNSDILIIAYAAMLLVILFSGLFSYPLTLLPFQILFYNSLSLLSASYDKLPEVSAGFRSEVLEKLKPVIITISVILGMYFMFYAQGIYIGYHRWYITGERYFQNNEIDQLAIDHPFLLNDPGFAVVLGNHLLQKRDYDKAINFLESAKTYCPNKSLYYTLGTAYKLVGKYDKAEEQYKFLVYALPGLVRPRYMLAKLYYDTKQETKWRKEALSLISFKPKVESNSTEAMIEEIKELYKPVNECN